MKGVIGIVANSASEMDMALERKLTCVEIRADLLLHIGHSLDEVMGMVESTVSKGLGSLFTLRHPEHGGKFLGSEIERSEINQNALEAGADIIDLEWGSDAAAAMIEKEAPIIISHHDFERMPGVLELKEMASEMEVCGPNAIKLVPTASTLEQSVQILKWVEEAADEIPRIGFAMGLKGTCSRLLT
ncbi:MAG: type I 3-dehydroquinate dehydratase, partial [Dehalococcoidia bacterium]|nr:type I 3-dehydroquinate dehydratase [Dehalococcoidia bacterium]